MELNIEKELLTLHNKLQENYFKIGINLTLNEMWFFKQRIQ